MKIFRFQVILLTAILLVMSLPHVIQAQTQETTLPQWCEGLGGMNAFWDSSSSRCWISGDVLLGDNVHNFVLNIAPTEALDNYGALHFAAFATLKNSGTINNFNYLTSNSVGSSFIDNLGTLNNKEAGAFSVYRMINHGTVNNFGGFIFQDEFTNEGIFNNQASVSNLQPFAMPFRNNGTLNNVGRFNGALTNAGTVDNQFLINAAIANLASGVIVNHSSIDLFYSPSPLNSTNWGVITNETNSIIENSKNTLTNYGTIENKGTINNDGTIENGCGGIVTGNPIAGAPVLDACTTDDTAPVITLQPHDVYACEPAYHDFLYVDFSAVASGNPDPTIQWQSTADNGATFYDLLGKTSTDLVLVGGPPLNGSHYRALFTNRMGSAASAVATLIIYPYPYITTQPESQTVNEGQSVTFKVDAVGSPNIGVQWERSVDNGTTWQEISGANATDLTFVVNSSQNNYQFRATVAGAALPDGTRCNLEISNIAILHVNSLDTTPPDTTLTSFPSNPSNSNSASFAYTSNEANSTFACSLDGVTFAACPSPQNYTGLSNGNHTFQVRAIDAAGNIDPTPASYTWVINTTPPTQGVRGTIQTVRASLAALLPAGVSLAETVELSATTAATVAAADDQSSTSKIDKKIRAALGKLDQALAANLWSDDNHLTLTGEKVFDCLSDAVRELLTIQKPPTAVTSAINTLTSVTQALAQTALTEAIAAHGQPNKIIKAQQEMSTAQQKLAKQQFTDAITHYKKAWIFAQQAVGKSVRATGVEDAAESESSGSEIFLPLITR